MNGLVRNWIQVIAAMSLIVPSVSFAASSSGNASSQSATSQSEQVAEIVPSGLLQIPATSHYYSPYAFVVDKQARALSVWHQSTVGLRKVASFPADLGKNSGDKRFTGDHKTPVGIYFLQERLEGNTLDFKLYGKRAFTTDYPNFFDRLEGKTGYGIWLHAVPDEVPLTRGSRGCVVVRNEAIVDLTQYIRLGRTPILIQEKAELIPAKDLGRMTAELNDWLEQWRTAWEAKNLDVYMEKYGDDFKALKMNKAQWREFKARLNEQYKSIAVKLSRPAIYTDRNRTVVRFLQEYTSDQHSDFGEKVLYLQKSNTGYRIVGETWTAESSQIARQEIESTMGATTAACTEGNDCRRTSASTSN